MNWVGGGDVIMDVCLLTAVLTCMLLINEQIFCQSPDLSKLGGS